MLSIGKLARGAGAYYVDAVADGAEDYYVGAGEAPGAWYGKGASRLGLAGRVERSQFLALLAGVHPLDGDKLARRPAKLAAFDLTFSAPKSVSLLYSLTADPDVARAVSEAHERAVRAALDWLETEAGTLRTGAGGAERTASHGWTVGLFRHRTSRAGDPQLHTHAVVANLAQGVADGYWRTVNSAVIFAAARTAGFLYQAELRAQLVEELGVTWGPVRKGQADLVGVPEALVERFATRRQEIEAAAGEDASGRAAQAAALDTRRAKQRGEAHPDPTLAEAGARWYEHTELPVDRLRHEWRAEAVEHVDRDLDAVLADVVGAGRVPVPISAVEVNELTSEHATFTRRDVLRLLAERAPDGAHVSQLLGASQALLAAVETVELEPGEAGKVTFQTRGGRRVMPDTPAMYTSSEQLAREQTMLRTATQRVKAEAGIASLPHVRAALAARPKMGADQAALVETLCRSGRGVDLVIGAAGTGKTYTLGAAREAWEASGYQVLGATHAGAAADQLAEGAGIREASTIDSLLGRIERDQLRLSPRSVLVVDEAEMAGTRRIAALVDVTARSGAKLVLVGDPAQLPSIDAGGPLAALAKRIPHSVVTENRRQQQVWERTAVSQLRAGQVRAALQSYAEHGRVQYQPTAEDRRTAMLDIWNRARSEANVLLLAGKNEDVAALNVAAQARRREAGELGAELVVNGTERFCAGDRLLLRRNDTQLRVRNGNVVTLAVDQPRLAAGLYAVDTEKGRRRYLPGEYLTDPGSAQLGYAMTRHKAQGATVDVALMTDDVLLSKEAGYVGMSRGRSENWIFTLTGTGWRNDEASRKAALDTLAYRLGRSDAKEAAVDVGVPVTPRLSPSRPVRQRDEVDVRIEADLRRITDTPELSAKDYAARRVETDFPDAVGARRHLLLAGFEREYKEQQRQLEPPRVEPPSPSP